VLKLMFTLGGGKKRKVGAFLLVNGGCAEEEVTHPETGSLI
jgi:hypothetical protein